jgi:hypothetical protein
MINQVQVERNMTVQAYLDLSASGVANAGVVARYSGTGVGNCYLGRVVRNSNGTFTAQLYRFQNGIGTLLKSASVTTGTGILRLEVVGTSLKLFFNDTLVTYTFDTTLSTGAAGMWASFGATLDDFSAAVISSTQESLPFSDDFTGTDGTQLSHSWQEQAGNFSLKGDQLQANDPSLSVAMVNHAAVLDMTVQASINLSLTGVQSGGVVGRASGTGLANFYMGEIKAVNGVDTAYLYVKIGSKLTTLKQQTVTSGSGVLMLKLSGARIQLFFNGLNVGDVTNTQISQAGVAGLRGNKGVLFDDFSVTTP